MSESDTDYFLVEGGEAKKHMDKYMSMCRAIRLRRIKFIKAIKAKTLYEYDDGRIAAVVFEKDPELLTWKRAKQAGWVPRRTRPKGKTLYKELFSLGMPDFPEVAKSIIGTGRFFWGRRLYHPGFTYLQRQIVILMPHPFGDKPPPKPINTKNHWAMGYEIKLVDGVRKLKRSEYWTMQEAESNKSLKKKLDAADRAKIPRLRERKKAASA